MITIDTTNMCSHLQKKLFEEDGEYHRIWIALQNDPELTAVVRSRQPHLPQWQESAGFGRKVCS